MIPKYQDEFQLQKQLNKQELIQLQHQRNVCETLFTTFLQQKKLH